MAGSVSLPISAGTLAAERHPIRLLLRLEGLAGAAISLALYARFGGGWVLFAALWLAPDLSLLAYLRSASLGARVYNALHSYVTPATLGLIGFLLHADLSVAVALIWANHIAIDRLFGYGLKYTGATDATHLGLVGRSRARV
jgi:hypothetical protein